MSLYRESSIALIMVGLLSGCSTIYQPVAGDAPKISVNEARLLLHAHSAPHARRIETKWNGFRVYVTETGPIIACRYDRFHFELGTLVDEVVLYNCEKKGEYQWLPAITGNNNATARRVADAIYVLKQDYLNRQAPETPQQLAAFEAVVKEYRATQPPPALPEGAVRYKAQAEFAVQQKRFDDAVDLYGEALKVAPWWPQGYYNRGLLLGELEGYTEAIRDLQKYLKLEPSAPNAQAVQTKIYQWESVAPKPVAAR